MSSVTVDSNLRRAILLLESAVEEALEDIGDDLVEQSQKELQRLVYDKPITGDYERTGELRESVKAEKRGTSLEVSADAPHAVHVHEGTRKMSPRPFLTNAMKRTKGRVEGLVAKSMRKKGFR